jgi:hypothetical protein
MCTPLIADAGEGHIVRLQGSAQHDRRDSGVPRFAPFLAAGFLVGHASMLREVP